MDKPDTAVVKSLSSKSVVLVLRPRFSPVEDEGIFMAVAAETQIEIYKFVDDIPGVADLREAERDSAWAMLETRRNDHELTPEALLPVDALSTAHTVLTAEQVYGEDSPEHREKMAGLLLDSKRLVGEWYRKNTAESFEPVRHKFDVSTEDFFSHGLSIRQMTENALVPLKNDPENETRRVNERVEEVTPQILRKLGSIAVGERMRTISECTDEAITAYQDDMKHRRAHRGYGGYVPEIEKVMLRDIWFEEGTDDRFEEVVALPGTYITHDIFQQALKQRGANAKAMDKTALHGAQFLARDTLIDFVAHLDEVASKGWCTNIFMGEKVAPDFIKDYDRFKQEAAQRQEHLHETAGTVTNFILDLARDGVDRRKAPAMVEDFVKVVLLDMAKQDGTIAEHMFDKKTAVGLEEVRLLEAHGKFDEAQVLMREVEQMAPGGGYCGAGSCGIEGVNTETEEGKEIAKNLRAEAGDKIAKDNERACINCHKKTLYYAYTMQKVNSFCNGCKAFKSEKRVVQ